MDAIMTPMTDAVGFRCNVCGQRNSTGPEEWLREKPSCPECKSTVRTRSVMQVLSAELFGTTLPAVDFPVLKGIAGFGISDSVDYSPVLSERFDYRNTWYHREPRFDITELPENERGRYDFVIASEVLEHVTPPVDRAFRNLFRMLKPEGVLILTVPYVLAESTQEHFPHLYDYALARLRDRTVLVNRTPEGRVEVHEDLCFHGGAGDTLEMRLFAERDLRRYLRTAGFEAVEIYGEAADDWGIRHEGDWSLPIAARKGRLRLSRGSVSDWAEQWHSALNALADTRDQARHSLAEFARMEAEFLSRTEWARKLETDLKAALTTLEDKDRELNERTEWALGLERDLQAARAWGRDQERLVGERTAWAQQADAEGAKLASRVRELEAETEELRRRFAALSAEAEELRSSPALRVGRKLGLG